MFISSDGENIMADKLVKKNKYGKVSYPELFAVMLFSVVPAVLLYAFAQKFIVNNVNIGGLKG